jgi:beta-glucosidase-like glycosyl hydrolase
MNFGKLFIVGFNSVMLTEELKLKLIKLQPAGIILYDCNIESREQVTKLIQDLKQLLGEDLLISIDQEGGKVQRARKSCTDLPSLKALGKAAIQDESFLELHSRILASELLELGFNLVYAPCADLNTNQLNPIIGTRSLGDDAKLVSHQLVKIHNSYRKAGIISCAKHFPGHGDAGIDSHLDLPIVKRTDDINDLHLEPFKSLIKNNIEMIMIAHLVVNEGLAASINPQIISALRKDLGYKGLIISDEITMKALDHYGDYNKLSELLIKAGNNLVIWNTNLDEALSAAEYLNSLNEDQLIFVYNSSLKLIKELTITQQQHTECAVESDNPLLEIAKLGIELHHHKEYTAQFHNQTTNIIILINQHPKLEKSVIEKVFALPLLEIAELESNSSFTYNQKFILIEFQIKDSDLRLVHDKVKRENLLHISTDIRHIHADLSLNGASLVHYQAIKDVLEME